MKAELQLLQYEHFGPRSTGASTFLLSNYFCSTKCVPGVHKWIPGRSLLGLEPFTIWCLTQLWSGWQNLGWGSEAWGCQSRPWQLLAVLIWHRCLQIPLLYFKTGRMLQKRYYRHFPSPFPLPVWSNSVPTEAGGSWSWHESSSRIGLTLRI